MNGQQINHDRDGFWWLDQIGDAVKRRSYDCTCQVGGVDAMSIDTDWLRHAARTIRDEHRAMAERAQVAEARIQAVRALATQEDEYGDWVVTRDAVLRALDGDQ